MKALTEQKIRDLCKRQPIGWIEELLALQREEKGKLSIAQMRDWYETYWQDKLRLVPNTITAPEAYQMLIDFASRVEQSEPTKELPTESEVVEWAEKEANRFYFPERSANERVRIADFIFAMKHFYNTWLRSK